MKKFIEITVNINEVKNEILEYKHFIDSSDELNEKSQILPFFRSHYQLSAYLASYHPKISRIDRLAFEYPIFGDYRADIVAGDSRTGHYCFIECENISKTSIFCASKRNTLDWSTRFEHGYGQIIDWFYLLSTADGNRLLRNNFEGVDIDFVGLLLIGKEKGLSHICKERLEWRERKIIVDSSHIYCIPFDKLSIELSNRMGLEQEIMRSNI
jgi:hypothetical protein